MVDDAGEYPSSEWASACQQVRGQPASSFGTIAVSLVTERKSTSNINFQRQLPHREIWQKGSDINVGIRSSLESFHYKT